MYWRRSADAILKDHGSIRMVNVLLSFIGAPCSHEVLSQALIFYRHFSWINSRQIPRAQASLCIPNVARLTAQGHKSTERSQLDRPYRAVICSRKSVNPSVGDGSILARYHIGRLYFPVSRSDPHLLYPSLMWVSRTSPVRHLLFLAVSDRRRLWLLDAPFHRYMAALHGPRKLEISGPPFRSARQSLYNAP